jgi:hypothetical protein
MIPLLVALFILIVGVTFALSRHPGFRGRSIEEVGHFILQVGEYLEDVEANLDPKRQAVLALERGTAYRGEVARLVRSSREFLRRMRINVNVLLEFAETERHEFNKARHAAIWSIAIAKAGHIRLSRLERSPGHSSDMSAEDENQEQVHPQQIAAQEEYIQQESAHLATLEERFQAIERFISVANRCYIALWFPMVHASMWNMVPFAKLRFLPLPALADFGHSKGVYVPKAYSETKEAALALIALLYPAAEEIRNEIRSQM